jgi:cytochrome c peroxidase
MNRRSLAIVAVVVVCVLALLMTLAKRKVSPRSGSPLSDSVYNPYPPGILPPDLYSEIDRVQREVEVIED